MLESLFLSYPWKASFYFLKECLWGIWMKPQNAILKYAWMTDIPDLAVSRIPYEQVFSGYFGGWGPCWVPGMLVCVWKLCVCSNSNQFPFCGIGTNIYPKSSHSGSGHESCHSVGTVTANVTWYKCSVFFCLSEPAACYKKAKLWFPCLSGNLAYHSLNRRDENRK